MIWNNRRQNAWLLLGLLVMSVCLWFSVDYLYTVVARRQQPVGFEWEHIYKLRLDAYDVESERYDPEVDVNSSLDDFYTIMDRLKQHPAVEEVCYTFNHQHYEWNNAKATFQAGPASASAWRRSVSPEYFRLFRVGGADGASPEEMAERLSSTKLIINRKLADELFPHSDAVGRNLAEVGQDSLRVGAVCRDQKYNEYVSYSPAVYQLLTLSDGRVEHLPQEMFFYGIYIRVSPEADSKGFIKTFRKEMRQSLAIGNYYLREMHALSDYRDEHLKPYRDDSYIHLTVLLFLLINVFLAVLGTFWSRTQYRRQELGIRMALGSTQEHLSRLLMGEGILLLGLTLLPTLIIAYNLWYAQLSSFDPIPFSLGRFFLGMGITYFLLAAVIAVSIWFPARQAMKIEPAEVLHEE